MWWVSVMGRSDFQHLIKRVGVMAALQLGDDSARKGYDSFEEHGSKASGTVTPLASDSSPISEREKTQPHSEGPVPHRS